jgi:hypothetical protein
MNELSHSFHTLKSEPFAKRAGFHEINLTVYPYPLSEIIGIVPCRHTFSSTALEVFCVLGHRSSSSSP